MFKRNDTLIVAVRSLTSLRPFLTEKERIMLYGYFYILQLQGK